MDSCEQSEGPGLESKCIFRDVLHKSWGGGGSIIHWPECLQGSARTKNKKGEKKAVEFEASRGWGCWGLHLFLREEKET